MKITREADYALRIVSMLAFEDCQVEAKTISEQKMIPYRFTLKILRKLVQAGIVKSFRGVNGGYKLNKDVSEITLYEIIETIDGVIDINRCITEPDICQNSGECKIQRALIDAQKVLIDHLNSITMKQVLFDGSEN